MDLSGIGNIVLGTYGAVLTTYTIIKANREKRRKLSVNVSTGWRPRLRSGELGPQLLLITVTNPGNRIVTVNVPYLELSDRKSLVTPIPLSNVNFPYRLEEGENCAIWIEMDEIKSSLLKQGYSGLSRLKGKVSDATGKVYTSKKSWDFDLKKEYD